MFNLIRAESLRTDIPISQIFIVKFTQNQLLAMLIMSYDFICKELILFLVNCEKEKHSYSYSYIRVLTYQ